MLRVLLITHVFPPCAEVGSLRAARFARYLPQHGIQPIVLTVKERFHEVLDDTLPHTGARVERIDAPRNPLDYYKALRQWWGRTNKPNIGEGNASPGGEPSTRDRKAGYLRKQILTLLQTDGFWGWYGPAIRAARKLIREEEFAAVITTAPPWTANLVGLRLKKEFSLPWLADFRDPWTSTFQFHLAERPGWRRYLDRRWESRTIENADRVICTTERHRQELRMRYPDLPDSKFLALPNGFDEVTVRPVTRVKDKRLIMHVGSLDSGRRIDLFCEAVARLVRAGKLYPGSFKILLIGGIDLDLLRESRRRASELWGSGCIELGPRVSWYDARSQMQGADLLLLFTADPLAVPAKFYEYLQTGLPIFAVSPPGALADTIAATESGIWVEQDDPEKIGPAFLRALELPVRSAEEVQRSSAPFQASSLVATLAKAIFEVKHEADRDPIAG